MSAIFFAAFSTNQKENVLQYLTEKIIVSMEKFMLPRKMLNIIVFYKVQHNAYHMLKKSPNLSLYMLINVMLIKKTCNAFQQQGKKDLNKSTRLEINPKSVYPYTLVVVKDLMKTLFPLAGKSFVHSQEYLQKSKKMVSASRNTVLLKN